MTDDEWLKAVDAYNLEINASSGEVTPTPFEFQGSYSFPIAHQHVNEDLIKIFANAIGDANPLWRDNNYARESRWGGIIAPPLYEACVSEIAKFPDPPQLSGWNVYNAGSSRRYIRPMRPGDRMYALDKWLGTEEKSVPGKPYKLFIQSTERTYYDQKNEPVCILLCRAIATGTPPSQQEAMTENLFSAKKRRQFTTEELDEIHQHYDDEVSGKARRGNVIRYWEDVEVEEELIGVIKGPYDITDAVAFFGAVGSSASFALKWQAIKMDIGRCPVDPDTGETRGPADWHLEDTIAQVVGLPHAHAFGTHMESMLSHAVTNWMGDDGFLETIDFQLRGVLFHKEVSYTKGKVSKKFEEDGKHLVELTLWSETQDGTKYATAKALVSLRARKG